MERNCVAEPAVEDAHRRDYPRVVMGVPVRAALLSTVWEEPRAGSAII
jgi:hypothetical protein